MSITEISNDICENGKPRIAFDAMGGDYAPKEIVLGAISAVKELGIKAILVGKISEIKKNIGEDLLSGNDFELVEANEEIDMSEKNPARAVRAAKNSSIVVANNLVAEGKADAVVAAGNTGAATAAALFIQKRIEGFERPCIVCVIPTIDKEMLLIDAGSNIETTPEQMSQNAILANIIAEPLLGVKKPKIGLLNVGGEPGKGNQLYKDSYELIENNKSINFVGNVEGKTIIYDNCDVAICDGFVGNIHLKALEGGVKMFSEVLKVESKKNPFAALGALILKVSGAINSIKAKFDPSEYGGAFLGGVNNIVIISHGSSNAEAIKNAAKQAKKAHEAGVITQIKEKISSK